MKLEKVTEELNSLQKKVLQINGNAGIFIGGSSNNLIFKRNWNSPTMQSKGSDEIYYRSGEFWHDGNQYLVEYKLKEKAATDHVIENES